MNLDNIAPFARILLRYFGAALISAGLTIKPDILTDPDVVQITCIILGAGCSALSEGWYYLARKNGWGR
ncbi:MULTISPECIES: hypothetical protein [unclassified Bradyrhizobium]|uniref:hypothetical protein n=1 Tax=unclassified Bradyrhizobium TaxID=2631580 RepID=UPI0028E4436F|nr:MULTISPECIES: hypothetical protein [unclassified Bradyrhizobium]